MATPAPSGLRRLFRGVLALLALSLAAGFAATWSVGSATWPPHETSVTRKIGASAAAIEAAVAKGGPATPIRIGIVGDIQNGISEFGDLLDSFRGEHLDFILQLGDAANVGLPARYAVLRKQFEEHAPGIPVIAVPGNHDIEPDQTTTVWEEWVGPPVWRLDLRGWRIVGLNDADARISDASMAVLSQVAKEGKPAGGTILIAHRPLGAAKDTDGIAARAKQIASSGLRPTMTISGHWHANDRFVDANGTIHQLLGENCDRASSGPNLPVTKAILTLPPGGGEPQLTITTIPRRLTFEGEFLRLAVSSVYPSLRPYPFATWVAIGALCVLFLVFAVAALRRSAPSAN